MWHFLFRYIDRPAFTRSMKKWVSYACYLMNRAFEHYFDGYYLKYAIPWRTVPLTWAWWGLRPLKAMLHFRLLMWTTHVAVTTEQGHIQSSILEASWRNLICLPTPNAVLPRKRQPPEGWWWCLAVLWLNWQEEAHRTLRHTSVVL